MLAGGDGMYHVGSRIFRKKDGVVEEWEWYYSSHNTEVRLRTKPDIPDGRGTTVA